MPSRRIKKLKPKAKRTGIKLKKLKLDSLPVLDISDRDMIFNSPIPSPYNQGHIPASSRTQRQITRPRVQLFLEGVDPTNPSNYRLDPVPSGLKESSLQQKRKRSNLPTNPIQTSHCNLMHGDSFKESPTLQVNFGNPSSPHPPPKPEIDNDDDVMDTFPELFSPIPLENSSHVNGNSMENLQNLSNIGIGMPLFLKGIEILQCMNEQQAADRQLVHRLLNQHNIHFQKQHKDILALHADANRQIINTEENTTRYIDAVHQSLFEKIETSESRLNELERNKRGTEESMRVLREHSEVSTSQYQILKEAQDAQLCQMNKLSKHIRKILHRGGSWSRPTTAAATSPQDTSSIVTSTPGERSREVCPHCNRDFSITYIAVHIKKHCSIATAARNSII